MQRNQNKTQIHRGGIALRCLTMLLAVAMLLQVAVIGVAASSQAGYLPGTGSGSSLSGSAGAIGKLENDLLAEQMREEILASIKKDLLQRVEDYEMTGHVGVILTFTDQSIIGSYSSSKYANKMTYGEYKDSSAAIALTEELQASRRKWERHYISEFFEEEFFETKQVVYSKE